jgi:hypothetical protein
VDYLPAKNFSMKVNKQDIIDNKVVSPNFYNSVVPVMNFELTNPRSRDKKSYKQVIYKNDMMVLDLVAQNDWKRPIYFAITVGDENYLGLEKYFRLDGLAYRLVPIPSEARQDGQYGLVDSKILYDNLMNKFKWGNVSNPKVYIDENNMRMLSNFRNNFARLAEQLINENKTDSAVKVLDKCFKVLPISQVPLNVWALPLIEQYYRANKSVTANNLTQKLFDSVSEEARYYFRLKGNQAKNLDSEKQLCLYTLNQLARITQANKQNELSTKIQNTLQGYVQNLAPNELQ